MSMGTDEVQDDLPAGIVAVPRTVVQEEDDAAVGGGSQQGDGRVGELVAIEVPELDGQRQPLGDAQRPSGRGGVLERPVPVALEHAERAVDLVLERGDDVVRGPPTTEPMATKTGPSALESGAIVNTSSSVNSQGSWL